MYLLSVSEMSVDLSEIILIVMHNKTSCLQRKVTESYFLCSTSKNSLPIDTGIQVYSNISHHSSNIYTHLSIYPVDTFEET